MARYCITAAKPKNAAHHLNSEFRLWREEKQPDGELLWIPKGWKETAEIAALLGAGHTVLTASEGTSTISLGAPVEMELRIAKNETRFKISEMPDK